MDNIEFSELVLILINNTVHFLVSVYSAEFLPQCHMFSIWRDNENMECVNINDLIDFYPLPYYIKDGYKIVPLKHSVLSN